MSEIASVVERARKAFALVSRLEEAISRAPHDRSLQLNLAAMRKVAMQSQDSLFKFSERTHVEVCTYRLVAEASDNYALPYISASMLKYQNLFSQIYDAKRNGIKSNMAIGNNAWEESILEFGYSYSGSLGVVLLRQGSRDLLSGTFDDSIDALYQVMGIHDQNDVRDVAKNLGNAVVKRLHEWSEANLKGGFAADVRWTRSDGRQLGEIIERNRMERIVGIIDATSDEKIEDIEVAGVLLGGDLGSGSFHFVAPNAGDYRGHLAPDFSQQTEMLLGKRYVARIRERSTLTYSTDKIDRERLLLSLREPDGDTVPI
ncbi:hypothetical protein HNR60_001869 [Rhodopseudomonas rhenobacensis]|uniref:Uncharacterized protein n=1 Tax=Rhodopseudomonas rhenobacensis TaxID=87461 RepID=A0A7W8DYT5_9BRAD|nr:hypothetical protein [Rhodopseudomonas rhenobacensis]MBB5047117.1 hypothetical protein [Rhodopseudomonas rhenobacensis]